MWLVPMIRLVVAVLVVSATIAQAAEVPPRCPLQPYFHKNGTATFEGRKYRINPELKVRLLDYHKHNPNCVMTDFAVEPGTDTKVMGKAIILLAEVGLLPDKVGFLIEPRNAP